MNFLEYLSNNVENLTELSLEHIDLVLRSMGLAILIGVPAGVIAHRSSRLRPPIITSASVMLTIPSLALLAIFVPIFGLGAAPAIAGLTLYALLPIINNTVAGLASVDPAIVKASRGMGVGARRAAAPPGG